MELFIIRFLSPRKILGLTSLLDIIHKALHGTKRLLTVMAKYLTWHDELTQYFHFIALFQLILQCGQHTEDASRHKAPAQCSDLNDLRNLNFSVSKCLSWHHGLTQHFHFIASFQFIFHFWHRHEDALRHKAPTQCQSLLFWEISHFLCAKTFGFAPLTYPIFPLPSTISGLILLRVCCRRCFTVRSAFWMIDT